VTVFAEAGATKASDLFAALVATGANPREAASDLLEAWGWRAALDAIAHGLPKAPFGMIRALAAVADLATSNHRWLDRDLVAADLDQLGIHPLAVALGLVERGGRKGDENNAFRARTLAKRLGVAPDLVQVSSKGEFRPAFWPDTVTAWPKGLNIIATTMVFDGRGTRTKPPLLPDGLQVAGKLYLRMTDLRLLPAGLQVVGDLHLERFRARERWQVTIPPDARIGGRIFTDDTPGGGSTGGVTLTEWWNTKRSDPSPEAEAERLDQVRRDELAQLLAELRGGT
jgi:hypothetical protein